ncbi:MAG: tetratricopeptide repeat protein [Spirochaetes bacterium]|nr:tetratricopeptide repeat protein [Spirochaetota bacterium]
MAEQEEISYTPEELEEIDRIVGIVERSGRKTFTVKESAPEPAAVAVAEEPVEEEPAAEVAAEAGEEEFHAAPESFSEPEDLSLPAMDLDGLTRKEEPPVPEAPKRREEGAPIEDITGLIHEVAEEFPEVGEEAAPEEIEEIAPPPPFARKAPPAPEEKPEALTTLDELDHLTSEEPESLDTSEIAPADEFVSAMEQPPPRESRRIEEPAVAEEFDLSEPILEEPGPIEEMAAPPAPAEKPGEAVSLGKEFETDIPDLSEISFEEKAMPEAREAEIPEIDIGGPPPAATMPPPEEMAMPEPELDELTDEDLAGIKGTDDFKVEQPSKDIITEVKKKEAAREAAVEEMSLAEAAPVQEEESFEVEMLEEEPKPTKPSAPSRPSAPEPQGGGIELTDRELLRLKRAILLFNPAVRNAVKDAVVNDLMPARETSQLISMILSGRAEGDIHKFLESKLGRKIPFVAEKPTAARRVITSRPEYSTAGRERQKRLLAITRVFGIAAAAACVLVVVGYQFIYKPYAAKRMIRQGTALIRESGNYLKKPKDYAQAEKIFRDVDENYIKDFAFGYLEYGRAYFDRKEYAFSVNKLNRIYGIQDKKRRAIDLDLLNSLGYFYARVSPEYYNTVRLNINRWYYPDSKKKREEWSQLDVAIEFYRRVLARERDNVTALYGIGNAYYSRGQYIKAKKYYEDIVGLEPDSAVGYAGLMNLYIERDVFVQVIDVHARLTEKKMLPELPSALLAKLAGYYLDKQKSATANVRVDYGVQSPGFKDIDDNIYPAVYAVLNALNKRDKEYPPLHLQYARLNKMQNNLKVMRIHLDKAIELSRKNYNADYFGALHLMGDYYYSVKEPVKAYETLNRAIRAAGNPPDFTRDDFYRETESTGKSYALLGNIFYYYFDRVRMRYGDLEDDEVDQEAEKLANYQIARDKYEKAIDEGFESPEVHYNLGRVYYLNRLYRKALDQWLNLYDDFTENPELMFALGNAFYHMGNYDAARGEYMKLISAYEYDLDRMKIARRDLEGHVKLITYLSGAYNNVGAVYQVKNNEAKSEISYWKAIDYAQRIDSDNEIARVNMARSFRQTGGSGEPILDESIPFSMDRYREDMRN